jgi:flagellar hook-length control protein FliK
LKLTLGENGMQVKISAGNSDVKNLINSQVSALSETLTNRGIQIDSIDVVYTGVDNSDLTHSRGQQEAPREQTRRRYAAPVGGLAELGFADISWAAQMLDLEVSSVEYSA